MLNTSDCNIKKIKMNYYKGLKEISKTGEFDKISTELLVDYINDFTLEFNNREVPKKIIDNTEMTKKLFSNLK